MTIEEPLRFPPGRRWDALKKGDLTPPPHVTFRTDAYKRILNQYDISHTAGLAERLIRANRADFNAAAASIPPAAWRFLYYRGFYVLESLSAYGFSAESALREKCSLIDPFDVPPPEWLGHEISIEALASDLEITLRHLGEGPSSAAWTVLALAKRVVLTQTEVEACPWWEPEWALNLAFRIGVT
jgi:hypothetical protein